jgi:DNA helicase II / ATP-dependent DNA helicase PcrA
MKILETLNDKQREAVVCENKNLLVLAGAGSGKTRVLTSRIAWLLQQGKASPFSILAVTFTNKAANEMKGRVEKSNGSSSGGMWIGTFHGLAHRFLRLHWQEANLPESFQILDSQDQNRLIKRILKSLDLSEEKWPVKQAQWFINNKKDEGVRPQYIDAKSDFYLQTMVKIYTVYEEACQRGGMVDFAELLLRSHELWLNKKELLKHYQQRFKHILVDEFQDTNTVQYAWIRMLAGADSSVMIVGDDDQSIYGWRGAKVENIQRFQKEFSDVSLILLEQNYRSTGNILTAANKLIANNCERMGKNLWTDLGDGDLISLYTAFNDRNEAQFIADKISTWFEGGNNYQECAVLYRSNAQSRIIEEILVQRGIPYRVYGGVRFFERLEIKDALAYMRLVDNRDNDAAFERAVNTPARGIGARTISFVRQLAKEKNVSMWRAAKELISINKLPARAANAVQTFLNLIDGIEKETKELNLDELTEHVLHASGLFDYYKKEKNENARARIENLEELVSATKEFELDDDEKQPLLTAFLSHAALEAGENQAGEFVDAVQLMTLHAAKGLEFPLVFLSGAEEGLFPSRISIEEGNLEEERRLCYVGMTRAMKKLHITCAEIRRLHGAETFQRPSRFLSEIPPECLEDVRVNVRIAKPSFTKSTYPKSKKSYNFTTIRSENNTGLKLGQNVTHHKFGEGVILDIEGSGSKAEAQVKFARFGIKRLNIELAKLQPAG